MRFSGYADNAAARSDAAYKRGHDIADRIPLGQPILVGHHSERRALRDAERIDSAMGTSIREGEKAAHWDNRAKAATNWEKFRNNPGVTLRRIQKKEADLRAVERRLNDESNKQYPDYIQEQERQRAELIEELDYWREVIAEAERNGFKVWGTADFTKGDFALYQGAWYEVLRVNAKSLTIPHIHNGIGRKVVRKGDGHPPGASPFLGRSRSSCRFQVWHPTGQPTPGCRPLVFHAPDLRILLGYFCRFWV